MLRLGVDQLVTQLFYVTDKQPRPQHFIHIWRYVVTSSDLIIKLFLTGKHERKILDPCPEILFFWRITRFFISSQEQISERQVNRVISVICRSDVSKRHGGRPIWSLLIFSLGSVSCGFHVSFFGWEFVFLLHVRVLSQNQRKPLTVCKRCTYTSWHHLFVVGGCDVHPSSSPYVVCNDTPAINHEVKGAACAM